MTNIHMKRCSTSLIIREIQLKPHIRYHLTPARIVIINNWTNKCWPSMWRKWNSGAMLVGMQTGVTTNENSMEFLKKLKMELPLDPAIPLLGIYLKESETLIWKISMYLYIYCRTTYNSHNLEAAKEPISRWVYKNAMVHLHHGILHGSVEEGNLTFCNSLSKPREYYAKWDNPVRERKIPDDFTYIWNIMNNNSKTK